jgi:peptidoglycan/LPS O-acetylase OafA/YrhL
VGWVHYFDFTNSSITRDFTFVGTPAEATGITLVLAGLVFGAPVVKYVFSLAPIRVIGLISYSAFLWHGPLLYVINQFPQVQALPQDERLLPILVRVVPLLLAVSIASYLLVEKPFLVSARRPQPERAPEAARVPPTAPVVASGSLPGPATPLPSLSVREPNVAP